MLASQGFSTPHLPHLVREAVDQFSAFHGRLRIYSLWDFDVYGIKQVSDEAWVTTSCWLC